MSAKKTAKVATKKKPAGKASVRAKNDLNQQPNASDADPKSGSEQTGAEDSDAQQSPPNRVLPDRFQMESVKLATQLVSAQIVASSNVVVANKTVMAVKTIAAEYLLASARLKSDLETLSSKLEIIDEAFVDRAYSNLMNAVGVANISTSELKPLDHPEHDSLFMGAMARAQSLLQSPMEDDSLIHAEQLFGPDERLSENQIGVRFEKSAWPILRNRDDYHTLMVQIERWFHDHLTRLTFPEEDERFEEDAEMMTYLLDLGRRRMGLEDDVFRHFYEMIRNHELPNQPLRAWKSVEHLSHVSWTRHLVSVIFCGRLPSQHRREERRQTRNYYPWGLFRFLRLHGNQDSEGSELGANLVTARKDLKSGTIIHPIHGKSGMMTDFGPLNRTVDQMEVDEMIAGEISSTVERVASKLLIEAARTVGGLPKVIDEDFQSKVLETAREGNCFNPKWPETIKGGFDKLLLSGRPQPLDQIVKFMRDFYIPLIASYGALELITERFVGRFFVPELLDLFPKGWTVKITKIEPSPLHHVPEEQTGKITESRFSATVEFSIQSAAGEEKIIQAALPSKIRDSVIE